jgi:hypothetical protein
MRGSAMDDFMLLFGAIALLAIVGIYYVTARKSD